MKYIPLYIVIMMLPQALHAASFVVDETKDQKGIVTVHVSLDPQGQTINAVSGNLSIPSDMADIESISTAGSVASLWLTQPSISKSLTLDGRKHVTFEAVMPGGFSGVRSAYYEGVKPGELFSFSLLPKETGEALLIMDNVDMRLNDGNGTQLPFDAETLSVPLVYIPGLKNESAQEPKLVDSTVQTFVTQDKNIAGGKWVLVIHDDTTDKTPSSYEVAESGSSNPDDVYFYEWRTATFPYVLSNQSRTTFIHIKATYTDGSYSHTTIQPVENSSGTDIISRILIGVLIAILLGYVWKAPRTRK